MAKTKKQRKGDKRIRIQNRKLIKRYPFLTPYNVWTGKLDKNYDYSYTWLLEGGWKKLQLQLCEELRELLVRANYLYGYRLVDVKEKYGMIRIYDNGVPRSIWHEYNDLINKYEELSEETCINCGKPAEMRNFGGWIVPYCDKCNEKIMRNYLKR